MLAERARPAFAHPCATATLLASLGLLAVPSAANADAIDAPPDDCPRGSTGTSSHTDTYCMPSSCTASANCTAPSDIGTERELVCTPSVGLCIETRTAMPGGRFPDGVVPSPITYDVAHGACTTDADCTTPAHCVVMSRCTPRTATEFVTRALGCSVGRPGVHDVPSAAETSLVSAALAAFVVARVARRRCA